MATALTAKQSNDVEIARTLQTAQIVHNLTASSNLRGLPSLGGAALAGEPIAIHDLNGEPLFHDYHLASGNTPIGTIRCAANRQLGSPVISISHDAPGWSPDAALRLAQESLHAAKPNARVTSSQLVCYAYPKIGVKLEFQDKDRSATQSEIFDASSGKPVADAKGESNQFTRYSLLENIPAKDRATQAKTFVASEQKIESLVKARPEVVAKPTAKTALHLSAVASANAVSLIAVRQGTVLLSPYCPNSPPGLTHYAQILDYFCVDASAQMLLEHYGYNYTQNQIAAAMGTSQANGGTTGAGLTSGFKALTNNTLTLTFDGGASRSQQFQDATTEISANRPLFTQVPHHYRVCIGYYENWIGIILATLGLNQMLYIYDPWPWNPDLCKPGAPYWENWATSPVMWFGIVHHS